MKEGHAAKWLLTNTTYPGPVESLAHFLPAFARFPSSTRENVLHRSRECSTLHSIGQLAIGCNWNTHNSHTEKQVFKLFKLGLIVESQFFAQFGNTLPFFEKKNKKHG